ncbi:MAG: DUF5615 family PIN-like protein [Phycisphaeraceae bacterium]|nr:DUF5615 family PIN-like protein [Phycisphaeraceae bacterium]
MKLLLDQGLGHGAASVLAERGHDAVHVLQIGLSEATDAQIIVAARSQSRVVVTLDGDFHAIMATSGETAPSVIRIRIEGLRSQAIALLIHDIATRFEKELLSGALVTADLRTIRARSLPI